MNYMREMESLIDKNKKLRTFEGKSRHDRLSWDDKWMLEACIAAQRSPDPNTQVGAVIVTRDNRPIGSGYNGLPKGINPNYILWLKEHKNPACTKYAYVVHAETNAIHNATSSTEGCILYTTLHPCNTCAANIIQAGIKEIVYLDNKYKDMWSTQVADWMFNHVDIPTRQHKWDTVKVSSCLQNLLANITSQG